MNEIGININAKATGDADIQKQINQLRQVSEATGNLTEFQLQYADATEHTGGNIKENIRLLREHEQQQRRSLTSFKKDSQFEYKQRQQDADTRKKKEAAKKWKFQQEQRAREWEQDIEKYGDEFSQYKKGVDGTQGDSGQYRGGAGMGLMQGLSTGGLGRGMIMGGMRKGAALMQGMGGMGKLALGGAIGGAAYLGFKALQWGAEGIEANKQFYQSMLPFRAALKDMGGDTDRLNTRMKQLSLNIGESTSRTIQLSKEWKKMAGGDEFGDTDQETMGKTLRRAMTWGIDKQTAISYVGQMARYGTYQDAGSHMNIDMMDMAIKGANEAGMGGLRREEYMQQVLGVVQNIAGTAGIVNDPATQSFISDVAGLGEPFRGQRGASFMGRVHGGLTRADQSGIKYLATRGMGGMGDASIFKLRSQQLKGLADPKNLSAVWEQVKGMYGGDMEMASMAFAKELGMEDQLRLIYNTDETDGKNLQDSIVEYLETGETGSLVDLKEKALFDPELMNQRYKETVKQLIGKTMYGAHVEGDIDTDAEKIAIAKHMSEKYGYGKEDLFTTREGLQEKSVIDKYARGKTVTKDDVYDYQSSLQEAKFEEDYGWKSNLGSVARELIKLTETDALFRLSVDTIDKTLTNLARHIIGMSQEEKDRITAEEKTKYTDVYDLFNPYGNSRG